MSEMAIDDIERWLPFYEPFFPSPAEADAFVTPLEALRLGDARHPAKIMMHQTQRLVSVSDDLPAIRHGNESLRLLFLLICAENIAKMADRFQGEGLSKAYVRNFFHWFLSPDEQRFLMSAITRHSRTPLTLQEAVDTLYRVRCDVVHEGKYWGFHFRNGDIPILNLDPDVIVSMTFSEFRWLVVKGCINGITRFPAQPSQTAPVD